SDASFGSLRHRARGDVAARGYCCGGAEEEAQPASTASSARSRRARVTGRYHTSRPMPRDFARLSPRAAVERLSAGMKVLVPPACGEPTTLLTEICAQSERLPDLTLLGGIHLGDFPYARPEHAALRAATWHMSPRLEDARRRGRVEFVPVRYFDVVTEFARGGHWAPDCVIVHTAPPDAGGYLSLG